MTTAHQTARTALLVVAICVAARADDAPRESLPSFTAKFNLLEPEAVEHPVASRSVASAESAGATSELPQVQLNTQGPESLLINEVSEYRVQLRNLGHTKAEGVYVKCPLPPWVEISSHVASAGTVSTDRGELVWKVPAMSGFETHQLKLSVVPYESRAFNLRFAISVQPTAFTKRITVQQPKLALHCEGAGEIPFAQPAAANVTVTNTGTGRLRDVRLELFAGTQLMGSHTIDELAGGEHRLVPIEVTAADPGRHRLQVFANAGSHSDSAEAIFVVKRGNLKLHLEGTRSGFAGQIAHYNVHVSNVGDAPVDNVLLSLNLPHGVEYSSGIASVNQTESGISWVVNRLACNEQLTFPIALVASTGGTQQLTVAAHTLDRLNAESRLAVEFIAAADVRLSVLDPIGPQKLGQPFDYQVQIFNPGTATARDITVVALLDDDTEIVDVSGTAAIRDGRIDFKPTPELAANHKMTFKIRVVPQTAGLHSIRVLVKSDSPETQLATQESTLVVDLPTSDATVYTSDRLATKDLLDLSYPREQSQPTLATPDLHHQSTLR